MKSEQSVVSAIQSATGEPFSIQRQQSISSGCINAAFEISDSRRHFFVKTNRPSSRPMFEAEREGLLALASEGGPRVPVPVVVGADDHSAFFVMEYVAFATPGPHTATLFGEQLAALHSKHQSQFGWHRDNTIGSTRQVNDFTSDWVSFLREQRFGYQFGLAARQGYGGELQDLGERFLQQLDGFFSDYQPWPSILHGDLWGGNHAADGQGYPVMFDPAVYYGDREADIAMTELFGRCDGGFYAAYDSVLPLDAGYRQRRTLYNLYHVLNHLNLFGGGYHAQALQMLRELVSEV
ncbi:MAG TPA: fructosamine kinase family protein [Chromatiales bacterium]|jgi:fructosamine-3-kinase|nr:fructosamine kinase family protein [Chromatiales bacterium]